jgi:hypothetical protein
MFVYIVLALFLGHFVIFSIVSYFVFNFKLDMLIRAYRDASGILPKPHSVLCFLLQNLIQNLNYKTPNKLEVGF